MLVLLPFLLVGAVLGWARGGRLRHLADQSFGALPLLWSAVALQLALGSRLTASLSADTRFGFVLASYALSGTWLVLNTARRGRQRAFRLGLGLVAAGWLLNAAAVVPNRGMPVSLAAYRTAGLDPRSSVGDGHLYKHVPAGPGTALRPLGDVIPVPPLKAVVSIGDLVMLAGVPLLVAALMRRPADDVAIPPQPAAPATA